METEVLSRRALLDLATRWGLVALVGSAAFAGLAAADVPGLPITDAPWPSHDGWERRTIAHFLNALYPGDDGAPLFAGDTEPLAADGDRSPGAWSAHALAAFYEPFFGAGEQLGLLATALDWSIRLGGRAFFAGAPLADQVAAIDRLVGASLTRKSLEDAIMLGLATVLGASYSDAATRDLGWAGPNPGYFDDARHPLAHWRQPARLTTDGNMP